MGFLKFHFNVSSLFIATEKNNIEIVKLLLLHEKTKIFELCIFKYNIIKLFMILICYIPKYIMLYCYKNMVFSDISINYLNGIHMQ